MAREEQQKEKHNQILQNIHEEGVQRKSEEAYRTKEMVSAVNKGFRNAEKKEEDSKSSLRYDALNKIPNIVPATEITSNI